MTDKGLLVLALLCTVSLSGCAAAGKGAQTGAAPTASAGEGEPEYFLLRPEVEKAYGYTHAIRIGNDLKISGAVSMDDEGNPTAVGDVEQQMKNAYSDLDKLPLVRLFGVPAPDAFSR